MQSDTSSEYSDDRIVEERFDTDSALASSTDSVAMSTPRSAQIGNLHETVLARRMMDTIRGGLIPGQVIPSFTLTARDGRRSLEQPPRSPRDPGQLRPLVRGDGAPADQVWYTVATAFSLLPGVRAEFHPPARCSFCTKVAQFGTPMIVLRHVCTATGTEQRVQMTVGRACGGCAGLRCSLQPPFKQYTALYIQDRIAEQISFAMMRLQPELAELCIKVHDEESRCDNCANPLTDVLLMIARRVDGAEQAMFVVCSDQCRAAFRGVFAMMTAPTSRVEAVDLQIGQWEMLSDDEVRECLDSKQPGAVARGASMTLHWCQSQHCFCHGTHRGHWKRPTWPRIGQSQAVLPQDTVVRLVYRELTAVHLYVDVLCSDAQTRCITCKRPAANICPNCWAVRTCSSECASKAAKAHAASCRPYAEAWSALVTL